MANNEVAIRNVKYLVAPVTYMVMDVDDILDINTSSGGQTILYIPNIVQNGLDRIPKKIYVNDVSNNASVGNITIVTLGGNTINNQPSLLLDKDGISAEIEVSDRTRYIAHLNTDDSGGGMTSVVHDASLFGNGTALNPLGVQGYYNNTIFVSPNGNDVTAEKGRITLPYQTIEGAKAVAKSGDLVYVFAGNYNLSEQLSKDGVFYYFQPNAIVYHNTWVLDDSLDGLQKNTKILGYGKFISAISSYDYGFSNIVAGSNFHIEFEEIYGDNGVNFFGNSGTQYIRGKYLTNSLQYVVVGYNSCVWDFNISKIDNRSPALAGNGTPTLIFALLEAPNKGQYVTSRFEFGEINNNANGNFSTLSCIFGSPYHKLVFKGDVNHQTDFAPQFMGRAIGVLSGGIVEYSGHIRSNGGIASIYGGFGAPDNTSILIQDSNCLHEGLPSDQWRPAIKVANPYHWITIRDSIVTTINPIGCSVGQVEVFGDVNGGNLQIENSTINNATESFAPVTPSSNIAIVKDALVPSYVLLNDVTMIIKNTEPSYSIKSGDGNPQQVSILSGGVTATNDVEPLLISNTIVGTNLVLAPQVLTNPLL